LAYPHQQVVEVTQSLLHISVSQTEKQV